MVWCGVVVLCGVCVWCGTLKNPPCVRSRRLCVYPENARMFNTCGRFRRTHGGVSNLHTEGFSAFSVFLALSLLSVCPSFCLFSSLLFSFLFLSSLLSVTMSMITRPVGSLCTHGSDMPECQSACASVHSLFGEHVRIMQESTVLA